MLKKLIYHSIKFVYFFNLFVLVFSSYSYAYIDPSTVTYVIQGVAGVFIALGAIITIFRHKIKAALRKWFYSLKRKNKK